MIIALLVVLGLVAGSFVNALVWRVYEQDRKGSKVGKDLSIMHGRSMCVHCKHKLSVLDLIPVLSWLALGGKCRYCKKPISVQYPVVELLTAGLFVASFWWWPLELSDLHVISFGLWLVLLTGLEALTIYDLKWQLLPNRIVFPLYYVAVAFAAINVAAAFNNERAFLNTVAGVVVGGGVFYFLYQISKGKWIGGGDVKLGFLLGAIVASPAKAVLFIFLASLLGTIVTLPLMATKKLGRKSTVPFGPFLIAGAYLAVLFGDELLRWYSRAFLM